jgi:hypothetical protein
MGRQDNTGRNTHGHLSTSTVEAMLVPQAQTHRFMIFNRRLRCLMDILWQQAYCGTGEQFHHEVAAFACVNVSGYPSALECA